MPQAPTHANRGRSPVSPWGLLEALAVMLGLATFTGFLGRLWWVFELTAHFRPHLAVGLFSVMALWLLRQQWRSGAVWGVLAVINLVAQVS